MSLTLLPADWRQWLLQQVERGVKPADLLRQLSVQGHLTAHAALRAIDEALTQPDQAGPRHAPTGCSLRPRLDTHRRLLDAQGQQVLLRAALESPGVAVLDNLLDGIDCALLRAAVERDMGAAAATGPMGTGADGPRPAASHPVIGQLAARLSALVHWPPAHFQPLQIRRLWPGDSCRPRGDSADSGRPAGVRGGPIVGSFVVYLDAPADGGAICLPGAMGFRALPQTGTAIWFDHQWPGGAGAAALQAASAPTVADPPWVVTAWLHAQAWHQAEAA